LNKPSIKKYDFCKLLAAKTRGKVDAKGWIKLLRILRETIADVVMDGKIAHTHIGTYEMRDSTIGKAVVPSTKEIVITGKDKKRLKYSVAPYFKGRLNGSKSE
jgi:hypothetical protein